MITFETEEYCTECDEVFYAVIDCEKFKRHEVGRIRCPHCGAVNTPCNACDDHTVCDKCPYGDAQIQDGVTSSTLK